LGIAKKIDKVSIDQIDHKLRFWEWETGNLEIGFVNRSPSNIPKTSKTDNRQECLFYLYFRKLAFEDDYLGSGRFGE
jgi:hypothetical protein